MLALHRDWIGLAMSVPFEASRLKMWRAGQHVASLENEIASYMARSPAHINIRTAEPPKNLDRVSYDIVVTEAIPLHFSAVIGDIFHNMRTSLDLLASDLVQMNGWDSDGIYFPFAKDATDLERMIKERRIDRAGPEVVDLVRSLAPYKGGNLHLRGVHDLDITDKHQKLVPVFARIAIPILDARNVVEFNRADRQGALKTGVLFSGTVKGDSSAVGEELPVELVLTFPSYTPFPTAPVLPLCKTLVNEFSAIIDSFERLCFKTVTKEFPWPTA